MNYTIDATDKKLGRLASEIAVLLRGKDVPTFVPYLESKNSVTVTNADKLVMTGRKMDDKMYRRYSGYPGGLREVKAKMVIAKKGYAEIIRHAVHGMLPSNKLRSLMLKKLTIKESTNA